ncbi:hypothetical protein F441_17132, partial [Phytophthora nicotianae CJ01A1]
NALTKGIRYLLRKFTFIQGKTRKDASNQRLTKIRCQN